MRDYLWKISTIVVVAALLLGCGGGKSKVTGVSVDKPAPIAEEVLSSDNVQQVTARDDTQRIKEEDANDSETPSTLDYLLEMIVDDEKAELKRLGGKPPVKKQVAALPDTKQGDEQWASGPPGNWQEGDGWKDIWSDSDNIEDIGFMAWAIYKFEGHSGDDVTKLDANIAVAPGNEFYIYVVNYSGAAQWQQFGPFDTPPEPPEWPLDITFQAVSALGNVYVAVVVYDLSMVRIHSLTVSGPAPDQLYPPEDLQASDGTFEDRIRITWSHPSSGPTPDGYKILRSTSENGSYQQTGSVDYPATQWDDENVPDYETYWYKARSFKSGYSDSGDSNKNDGYRKPDYDEEENNDSRAQANPFPSFDFTDFTGSLGPGGYDGDDNDWFKFSHSDPVGWTVKLWLHLDSSTGDLDMVLEDSNGDELDGSSGTGDEEYIEYTFESGDTSPFYLHVYAFSGYSDYSIDGVLIAPQDGPDVMYAANMARISGSWAITFDRHSVHGYILGPNDNPEYDQDYAIQKFYWNDGHAVYTLYTDYDSEGMSYTYHTQYSYDYLLRPFGDTGYIREYDDEFNHNDSYFVDLYHMRDLENWETFNEANGYLFWVVIDSYSSDHDVYLYLDYRDGSDWTPINSHGFNGFGSLKGVAIGETSDGSHRIFITTTESGVIVLNLDDYPDFDFEGTFSSGYTHGVDYYGDLVFVTKPNSNLVEVWEFNPSGDSFSKIDEWDDLTWDGNPLVSPMDISVDGDGYAYIASASSSLELWGVDYNGLY